MGFEILSPLEKESHQKAGGYSRISELKMPLEVCDAWLDFKPERVVDRISPRPILFLGSETSVVVPPEEVPLMFEKAKEPKKLIMFPPSVVPSRYAKLHADTGRAYVPQIWKHIAEWFQTYIPVR